MMKKTPLDQNTVSKVRGGAMFAVATVIILKKDYTLTELAVAYSTPVENLKSLNGITDDKKVFKAGEKVTILA